MRGNRRSSLWWTCSGEPLPRRARCSITATRPAVVSLELLIVASTPRNHSASPSPELSAIGARTGARLAVSAFVVGAGCVDTLVITFLLGGRFCVAGCLVGACCASAPRFSIPRLRGYFVLDVLDGALGRAYSLRMGAARWQVDQLIEDVARLGRKGLPREEYYGEVATRLRRVVDCDATCWHTLDPQTRLITSDAGQELISEGVLTPETISDAGALILASEYFVKDVNTFAELAARRAPVGILSHATSGKPERSARLPRPARTDGDPVRAARSVRQPRTLLGSG